MFRIFLTNLGKYNEGYLVGKWVDLPCDDLESELKEIGISDEPDENGIYYEEYFITDYENDFGYEVSEYENLDNLNDIAGQIEDLDEDEMLGFQAYIEYGSGLEEALEKAQDGDYMIYRDCYDMTDVAYEVVDKCDYLKDIPENIAMYFDYGAFGRDLDIEGTFIQLDNCIVELY